MNHYLRAILTVVCVASAVGSAVAQDMPLSQVLIDGEPWKLAAKGFKFTEGPAFDKNGVFYFSDPGADQILRLESDGSATVVASNCGKPAGMMFGADGRLYVCQIGAKKVVSYDVAATPLGEPTVLATDVAANDLTVAHDGTIYFTETGAKKVWRLAEGKKTVVDEGIERPNGITFWPDQKTLVVADSAGSKLWTFRIEADGSLSAKEGYYTVRTVGGAKESGADGMTVDTAGRLYVTTNAGLQVFDPIGRLSGVIVKPQNAFLANVKFGGPKSEVLYVTTADKVYTRKTKATGVRTFDPPAGVSQP
ncbi:MAG: SMP-30/gluconolactonase/LRE family protein [Planctomycetia bacterium]